MGSDIRLTRLTSCLWWVIYPTMLRWFLYIKMGKIGVPGGLVH